MNFSEQNTGIKEVFQPISHLGKKNNVQLAANVNLKFPPVFRLL